MDRFNNMTAFVTVAETGSFSGAARRLRISTSVITKRVRQLEDHLRVRLFDRTTRRVSLTSDGADYRDKCQKILADVDEAEQVVGETPLELSGSLRICCPTSFGALQFGKFLCAFQQKSPDLDVELILNDREVNPVDEGFDLVIRDQPSSWGSLKEEQIVPSRRIVCAAPAYLRSRGKPRHPSELSNHDCIHYSFLPTGTKWHFRDRDNRKTTVKIKPRFRTNSGSVMLDAAKHGRGIAILPTFLAGPSLLDKSLQPLLLDYALPDFWITLVHAPAIRLPAKVQLLINDLKEEFAPIPEWDRKLTQAITL